MYLITPTDPKIILFGIYENQIYGFGEKNGKLCIYTKAIFDIGGWKEFYLIDINVVKCEECDTGIHVAGGVFYTEESAQTKYGGAKQRAVWIAAREKEFTRIFSINIFTKEFISYQMLKAPLPWDTNLNLCCKCLSPVIKPYEAEIDEDFVAFYVVPQRYQSNVGIFHIQVTIKQSIRRHLVSKSDIFALRHPPLAGFSNILFNADKEVVISVSAKNEENGRIQKFSKESADAHQYINFPDDGDIDWIWHEISFCKQYYLTRRKEGNKSILRLYAVIFRDTTPAGAPVDLFTLDYCTVDDNFPSLQLTHFFISWRIVDEKCQSRTKTNKVFFDYSQLYAIPSIVVFQTADGSGVVTIPFRVLSLSEAAYLTLARISHWPIQRRPLPVAKVSIYHGFFQRIRRNLYGRSKRNVSKKDISKEEVIQCNPWMTQDFIKAAIGWPQILPLTKAPKLPKK